MPEDTDAGKILEAPYRDEVSKKLQIRPAALFLFVSVSSVPMVSAVIQLYLRLLLPDKAHCTTVTM